MNRRVYLISRDKKFTNQFSVHFLFKISSFLIANSVLSDVQIKKYGLESVNLFSNRNINSDKCTSTMSNLHKTITAVNIC